MVRTDILARLEEMVYMQRASEVRTANKENKEVEEYEMTGAAGYYGRWGWEWGGPL